MGNGEKKMKFTIKLGICMLAIALLCTMSTVAFADNFSSAGFTFSQSSGTNGFVTPNAPSGFYIQGTDGAAAGDTTYSTTFAYSGNLSFDWTAHSNDSDGFPFDPFSIKLNGGTLVNVAGGTDANGSLSFAINAGDSLVFNIHSLDGCCGPSMATISSFNTSSVPEPGSIALLGTGLLGLGGSLRRKIRL